MIVAAVEAAVDDIAKLVDEVWELMLSLILWNGVTVPHER